MRRRLKYTAAVDSRARVINSRRESQRQLRQHVSANAKKIEARSQKYPHDTIISLVKNGNDHSLGHVTTETTLAV